MIPYLRDHTGRCPELSGQGILPMKDRDRLSDQKKSNYKQMKFYLPAIQ
ncbi:hypothetical protein SAMN03080617_03958 [Algoriphagus alkaliphilus]|uniref:Uncharacterized protein n=1 Tax=Algoriphagus alkaliphilus TaxID=279824 RepID=A0A1G5ZIZ4_9BACT|nr:hypothetical protein SAMN03080617_03958 [Algoriphagus alkaliphilus]